MEEPPKFAIHAAAREGKVTVVESLLNAEPKLARQKDDDGRLPIHWAASSNKFEIASLLVQQKDFDPDAQDDIGWTPLMIAASVKDSDKIVDLLLAKGADVNQKNSPPLRSLQKQPRHSSQALRPETPRLSARPRRARPIPAAPRGSRRLGANGEPAAEAAQPDERDRQRGLHGAAPRRGRGARRHGRGADQGGRRAGQEGRRRLSCAGFGTGSGCPQVH
ncbi:ankyrin repeat-containing domain protein [Podospora appendiculata]|uniref:Ankyrin repeat-containing domain protein n=1 Tax=Podospora appendiculata TaxID=314037 RepID=A0AAE1CGP4_9PEZI|nr:ankyrin repeat-containing domain protein [Podospora appendiculata]